MIALDSNVLVRLIVEDDAEQAARARAAIVESGATVQMTVLLETAWVLRQRFGLRESEIVRVFERLAENDHINTPERFGGVLDAVRAGIEIDDAIHLVESPSEHFLTFDKRLIKRAPRIFERPKVSSP